MNKFLLLTLGALAIVGCSRQKADTTSESEQTEEIAEIDSASVGVFEVLDCDGYKLHIYLTEDEMADASFIIEGKDSIVTLEQPLFKKNANEYNVYLASLNKPVAHRIADFHLGNTGASPILMPEGMPKTVNGPEYSGMMKHFAEVYGDAIEPLPTGEMLEMPFGEEITLAGVPFKLYKGASNDFPGANILIGKDVVYSHWAPSKSHINTLYASDIDGINARLSEQEEILATGASTFVGGHGAPASADNVRFRISYLNKVKELLQSEPNAEAFATALIAAYPGLAGKDGVQALAESLYKSK